MPSDEQRRRARDLLDALAEGDALDRALARGEVVEHEIIDVDTWASYPRDIGCYYFCRMRNSLIWAAPPMVVNAVKSTLSRNLRKTPPSDFFRKNS